MATGQDVSLALWPKLAVFRPKTHPNPPVDKIFKKPLALGQTFDIVPVPSLYGGGTAFLRADNRMPLRGRD
jgi:hypothetical protein